ncbi:MAG TPA: hypothetical protein VNI52_01775 [Sphingobacteriaceae bacterium]|nr:hypothetical protein [Sphingobacteriaceae bacterium]
MDLDKRHSDWEKDAPNISLAGRGNPFAVPESYFTEMREHLTSQFTLESFCKDPGFNLPEGYFNQLPDFIEAKIAVEELKEELSTEGFKVPHGYFDTLSQKIGERTTTRDKTRIQTLIPMWMNYAAAACITVIIGVFMFFNMNQDNISSRLAQLPDQEIESYLNLYTDQTDIQVIEKNTDTREAFSGVTNTISEKDLEEYIETTSL